MIILKLLLSATGKKKLPFKIKNNIRVKQKPNIHITLGLLEQIENSLIVTSVEDNKGEGNW